MKTKFIIIIIGVLIFTIIIQNQYNKIYQKQLIINSTELNQDILQTIQYLSKPMLWVKTDQNMVIDKVGKEVSGIMMRASKPVKYRQDNFGYLVKPNSLLVSRYGWEFVAEESTDKFGALVFTFKKIYGDKIKKLIIYQDLKEYKVFLSD